MPGISEKEFRRCSYAISIFAGDGDGDTDVLSASALDSEINWYENLSIVGVESISNEIPTEFIIEQNFPNPFNPSTKIEYSISSESFVQLKVYDILGNEYQLCLMRNNPQVLTGLISPEAILQVDCILLN